MKYGRLLIKRMVGERILIGQDIVIEVHSVQARSARITIVAPKSMTVIREELDEHATYNPLTIVMGEKRDG
jgi:carbon storage regulator CsrA